jgi:hypothetical protein
MAILGIKELTPLIERTPALDHVAALAEAAAWVAARDPDEKAPRESAVQLSSTQSG